MPNALRKQAGIISAEARDERPRDMRRIRDSAMLGDFRMYIYIYIYIREGTQRIGGNGKKATSDALVRRDSSKPQGTR